MLNRLKIIAGTLPYKLIGYWVGQVAWAALYSFLYVLLALNVIVFVLQLIFGG